MLSKKKSHRRTMSDSVATRVRPPLAALPPAAYQAHPGRFVVPNPAHHRPGGGAFLPHDGPFGNKAGGAPSAPGASPGPPTRRIERAGGASSSPRPSDGNRRVDPRGSPPCAVAANDEGPPRRDADADEGLFRGTQSSTPRSFYGDADAPTEDPDGPSRSFRVTGGSTPRSFYGSVPKARPTDATAISNPGADGERNGGGVHARRVDVAPGTDDPDGNIHGGDCATPLLSNGDRTHAGDGRSHHRAAFDYDGLIRRFELFRRVIEHEDDLLNQRVAWTLLAESFLMAAFITAKTNDDTDPAFLYATASVGLGTVLVTLPALVAAGRNVEVQQRIYFEGLPSDAVCRALHGHDRDRGWRTKAEARSGGGGGGDGGGSSHLLPNMAFRSRCGVPIVVVVVLLSAVQVVGWCFLLAALSVVGGTDDGVDDGAGGEGS